MLYILTGDIQTGKTRWLQRLLGDFVGNGGTVYGVTAPGIWVKPVSEKETSMGDDGVVRQKTGIDTILWPKGERFAFAVRNDLHQQTGPKATESSKAGLGWAIEDAAIERVNAHFENIAALCDRRLSKDRRTNLLVVDELGRLELLQDGGFIEAVNLLDRGPTTLYEDAVVVVRRQLSDRAEERFRDAWTEIMQIKPDEKSKRLILKNAVRQ